MATDHLQALQDLLNEPAREQGLLDMIDQDMREGPMALQRMRAIGQMPQQAMGQIVGKVQQLPGVEGLTKVGTKVGQAGVDGLKTGEKLRRLWLICHQIGTRKGEFARSCCTRSRLRHPTLRPHDAQAWR